MNCRRTLFCLLSKNSLFYVPFRCLSISKETNADTQVNAYHATKKHSIRFFLLVIFLLFWFRGNFLAMFPWLFYSVLKLGFKNFKDFALTLSYKMIFVFVSRTKKHKLIIYIKYYIVFYLKNKIDSFSWLICTQIWLYKDFWSFVESVIHWILLFLSR